MIVELIIFAICLLYIILTWNNNYWKKLNIDYIPPSFLFGNIKDAILFKKSFSEVFEDLYRMSDKPAVGVFKLWRPMLLVRDPALIKIFLVNEFNSFQDNAYYSEPSDFIQRYHPFFLPGQSWKRCRSLATPSLTPTKLKAFVPQITSICQNAVKLIQESQNSDFEVRLLCNQYTTDTIISCVYGLRSDALTNPDSKFRLTVLTPKSLGYLYFNFITAFPSIGNLLKLRLTPKAVGDFYCRIIREAVDYRKENSIQRNDFLQYLINCKDKNEMTIEEMGSYTMIMAVNGIESSGVTLSHFLQILSERPDVQNKIRQEFKQNIQSIDNITYENIHSLPYLNAAFQELIRLRTPVPLLEKVCTEDKVIEFKGHTYKMTKGTMFSISLHGVHMDPDHFRQPELYMPERFLEEPENPALLPFSVGPRACLGKLFAAVQVKIFIAALLNYFEVIPSERNPDPVVFDEKSTFLKSLRNDYYVCFKPLK